MLAAANRKSGALKNQKTTLTKADNHNKNVNLSIFFINNKQLMDKGEAAAKAIKTCVKTDLSLNQIGTHSEYGIANVLEKCSPEIRAQL